MTEDETPWLDVTFICRVFHRKMYVCDDLAEARLYAPRLAELVALLPAEIEAILHTEALALHHELREEWGDALKFRRKEVQLMELLYADILENDYEEETASYVLQGRGEEDYQARLSIIEKLERRVQSS